MAWILRVGIPFLVAGGGLAACGTVVASQPAPTVLNGRGTPTTLVEVTPASYRGERFPAALLTRRYLNLSITCKGAVGIKLALPTRAGGEFATVACPTVAPVRLSATSSQVGAPKLGIATAPTTSWHISLTASTHPDGPSFHALPKIPNPFVTPTQPRGLPTSAPACQASRLSVSVTDDASTAGSIFALVTLSNTATTPCSLAGYPTIIASTATGEIALPRLAPAASLPFLPLVITRGGKAIVAPRALAPVVLAHGRESAEIPLEGSDNCTSDASAVHYQGFAIGIGTGTLQLPASAFSGIPNLMSCAPNQSPAPLEYGPYWPSWGFVYNTNLGPLPAGA